VIIVVQPPTQRKSDAAATGLTLLAAALARPRHRRTST